MERFGFDGYSYTDDHDYVVIRTKRTLPTPEERLAESLEAERKEIDRLVRKARKKGMTVEEVKREEREKAEIRRRKNKYKRYLKEVEALKRELAYKTSWIETYEKENGRKD